MNYFFIFASLGLKLLIWKNPVSIFITEHRLLPVLYFKSLFLEKFLATNIRACCRKRENCFTGNQLWKKKICLFCGKELRYIDKFLSSIVMEYCTIWQISVWYFGRFAVAVSWQKAMFGLILVEEFKRITRERYSVFWGEIVSSSNRSEFATRSIRWLQTRIRKLQGWLSGFSVKPPLHFIASKLASLLDWFWIYRSRITN